MTFVMIWHYINKIELNWTELNWIEFKKALEWQHVADTVNAASSEGQTLSEIKKKSSNIKLEAQRHIVLQRRHGRGQVDTRTQPPWWATCKDNWGIETTATHSCLVCLHVISNLCSSSRMQQPGRSSTYPCSPTLHHSATRHRYLPTMLQMGGVENLISGGSKFPLHLKRPLPLCQQLTVTGWQHDQDLLTRVNASVGLTGHTNFSGAAGPPPCVHSWCLAAGKPAWPVQT